MPTLEEIEREYDQAIQRAGRTNIAAANELKIEKAEAIAKHRMTTILERERKLWKREALHDFPLAAEFEELVTGETEDEVRQSAQALHERIDRAFTSFQRQVRINQIVKEHLAAEEADKEPEGEGDAAAAD